MADDGAAAYLLFAVDFGPILGLRSIEFALQI